MEKITKFLPKIQPKAETAKKTNGGINAPFNAAIGRVCALMDDRRFGYWCGRLRKFGPQEIDAMISIARRDGKNPGAYFNWMLKKKLSELSTLKLGQQDKV